MRDVTTEATRGKKPKKQDVFMLAKRLARGEVEQFTDEERALLYGYFLPRVPKKGATSGPEWVARACSKDETRKYLLYLHSDGRDLVGTDGHRLHMLSRLNWPEGFYNLAGDPISPDVRFPNIKPILERPSAPPMHVKLSETKVVDCGTREPMLVYVFDEKPGVGINKRYMDEAARGLDDLRLDWGEPETACHLRFDDGLAVIMPMRL